MGITEFGGMPGRGGDCLGSMYTDRDYADARYIGQGAETTSFAGPVLDLSDHLPARQRQLAP